MRVIAGEARGRRLSVPRGTAVRPSGARWRESAFGILEHRMPLGGARVLDLFAGTGALGIEALSRGAERVVAVERDPRVASVLARNAAACGFEERVEVRVEPVERALDSLAGAGFDLALVDPPYASGALGPTLAALVDRDVIAARGWVLVEHDRRLPPGIPDRLAVVLERRQGDAALILLRPAAAFERGGEEAPGAVA